MRKAIFSYLVLTAALLTHSSNAPAQSGVTLEDLKQCRAALMAFQNAAIEYFRNTARSCSDDPKSDCHADWQKLAEEIAAQDHAAFFWEGNGSCNGSGYTCFGKQSLDFLTENPELVQDILSRKAEPPLTYRDGYPEVNSNQADQCILQAWQKRIAKSSPDSTQTFAGEDATHCVAVVNSGNGGRSFKNNCDFSIEIAWCYEGKDCRNGNWGYTNTWSYPPGSVRSASTFSSDLASSVLHFAACKGAHSILEEVGAHRHLCH